jgi:hypothetical protein
VIKCLQSTLWKLSHLPTMWGFYLFVFLFGAKDGIQDFSTLTMPDTTGPHPNPQLPSPPAACFHIHSCAKPLLLPSFCLFPEP